MNVYLLRFWYGEGMDFDDLGVFSTRERAEEYAAKEMQKRQRIKGIEVEIIEHVVDAEVL